MAREKKLARAGKTLVAEFTIGPNAGILTAPNVAMFIADGDYEVLEVVEIHETLGTDGGAVTADIVKCTGTQAALAGATVLASTFNLKATINTVVRKNLSNGGLTTTAANRRLTAGDRLCAKFTGVLAAVTGVRIQAILKQSLSGHQPNY